MPHIIRLFGFEVVADCFLNYLPFDTNVPGQDARFALRNLVGEGGLVSYSPALFPCPVLQDKKKKRNASETMSTRWSSWTTILRGLLSGKR